LAQKYWDHKWKGKWENKINVNKLEDKWRKENDWKWWQWYMAVIYLQHWWDTHLKKSKHYI